MCESSISPPPSSLHSSPLHGGASSPAGKLVPKPDIPAEETAFQQRYVQAPSFLSMHVGVRADVLPPGTECHHLILEVSRAVSKYEKEDRDWIPTMTAQCRISKLRVWLG